MAMSEGIHEYGKTDPFALPDDMDARVLAEAEAQRVKARQATVPTLAEVMSAMPMVAMPDGAVMPAKLADRPGGWGGDEDRDSNQAAKLADLVRRLDSLATVWTDGPSDLDAVRWADDMATTWINIRKITRAAGGK